MEYDGWRVPLAGRRGCLVGIGLALVLGVAAFGVHAHGKQRLEEVLAESRRVLGPTDPSEYAPPPVAPEDDLALRLAELATGLEGIPTQSEDVEILRLAHRPPGSWDAADLDRMAEFLAERAAALAGARGLAARSGADFGTDREGEGDLRHLRESLQVERLLYLHAAFAGRQGDAELALPSLAALGRVADALYAESTEVHFSMASEAESDLLRALHALLESAPMPSGADGAALLAALEGTLPHTPPFAALRRTAGFEVAFTVHRLRTLGHPPFRQDTPIHRRLLGRLAGDWIVAENTAPYLSLEEAGRLPLEALEARYAEIPEPWLARRGWRVSQPGLNLARRAYGVAAARRLAHLALRVAQEGARRGRYPEALPTGLAVGEELDGESGEADPSPAASPAGDRKDGERQDAGRPGGDRPRDPVTGEPYLYRTEADRSVVLAADEGARRAEGCVVLRPLPWEWRLPPLGGETAVPDPTAPGR